MDHYSITDPDLLPGHILHNNLHMVTTTHQHMQKLMNFRFHSTDIVIVTYPRSGTLLTSEMVWQIKHKSIISRGSEHGLASTRVPMLEMNAYGVTSELDKLNNRTDEPFRLMKTHIPYKWLNNLLENSGCQPKFIVTIRNPKDVAVSLYYFYHNFPEFEGWPFHNWNLFLNRFLEGRTMYNGIFEHNKGLRMLKDRPNVLWCTYERLTKEPLHQIRRIADFLDESLTLRQEEIILNNIQFSNMYQNPQINFTFPQTEGRLMRKGKVGDWKNHFSEEQSVLFDKIMALHLEGSDLTYEFE